MLTFPAWVAFTRSVQFWLGPLLDELTIFRAKNASTSTTRIGKSALLKSLFTTCRLLPPGIESDGPARGRRESDYRSNDTTGVSNAPVSAPIPDSLTTGRSPPVIRTRPAIWIRRGPRRRAG